METGLLINIFKQFGLGAIGQGDLLERIDRNQGLEALSMMSFAIIQTVLRKIEIRHTSNGYFLTVEEFAELERPPRISLPAYKDRPK